MKITFATLALLVSAVASGDWVLFKYSSAPGEDWYGSCVMELDGYQASFRWELGYAQAAWEAGTDPKRPVMTFRNMNITRQEQSRPITGLNVGWVCDLFDQESAEPGADPYESCGKPDTEYLVTVRVDDVNYETWMQPEISPWGYTSGAVWHDWPEELMTGDDSWLHFSVGGADGSAASVHVTLNAENRMAWRMNGCIDLLSTRIPNATHEDAMRKVRRDLEYPATRARLGAQR